MELAMVREGVLLHFLHKLRSLDAKVGGAKRFAKTTGS